MRPIKVRFKKNMTEYSLEGGSRRKIAIPKGAIGTLNMIDGYGYYCIKMPREFFPFLMVHVPGRVLELLTLA